MDAANDVSNLEWPVRASCYRVRTATADPTPTQVDVNKSISAQELKSLKKRDPFLYYSIPGVRDAAVRLEDADMHQIVQNGLNRKSQSCSARIQGSGSGTSEPAVQVQRCTRLSFESYPDLLWDEMDDLTDTGKAPKEE